MRAPHLLQCLLSVCCKHPYLLLGQGDDYIHFSMNIGQNCGSRNLVYFIKFIISVSSPSACGIVGQLKTNLSSQWTSDPHRDMPKRLTCHAYLTKQEANEHNSAVIGALLADIAKVQKRLDNPTRICLRSRELDAHSLYCKQRRLVRLKRFSEETYENDI